MTGARAVANVIARMDDPVVYGMPGGYTMQIFDGLREHGDGIRTVLVREESLGTVMAEAHGRLTGRPAVVMGQGAWVLGNAGIGIMEALLGCSPMVILIDATDHGSFSHMGPYQGGLGGYGAYDLPAAMRAITKRTFVAHDPTQALQMTQLAIKHATTGEQGPVAVIFTSRSVYGTMAPGKEPPAYLDRSHIGPGKPLAPEQDLERIAEFIARSTSPLIIAGNGVRVAGSEEALLALAEKSGIPVVTTPAGKGTFPEDHELALGLMGPFGHESAIAAIGQADLLIALGTKLGTSDTANYHPAMVDPARQVLVQVDVEPLNLSWTQPIDVPVLGDLADALPRLTEIVSVAVGGGAQRVQELRDAHGYFDREFTSTPGKFSARDAVAVLSAELPHDSVVTCDAGENRLYMLRDFQSKRGGTVLQPNGGGGMGYAVPSAASAAFNFPERTCVAVCGDGGMAMTLHGLVTAVELGLRMTVVVLDNQILGWVYHGQKNRIIASEFKDFDYAAIASAIGCRAEAVDDVESFRDAVKASLAHEGVSVIVARTSRDDRYQQIMSSLSAGDPYAVGGDDDE
ncbi:MAG: thiamine pyrophosphate-binding protein [Candidatus Nanopelagicales bacterium]